LNIDDKLAARNVIAPVFDHQSHEFHEHRYGVYDVINFFVIMQLVVYFNEVRNIKNVYLFH